MLVLQKYNSAENKSVYRQCLKSPQPESFVHRAHSRLGIFEGKQYIQYDKMLDPQDGAELACISAFKDDVACCEINNTSVTGRYQALAVPDPFVWSLMGAITGPMEVPDLFRYVVLDNEEVVT